MRLNGMRWQGQLQALVCGAAWDVVCVGLNLRHLARVYCYLRYPRLRSRWVWRGHIFGALQGPVVAAARSVLMRGAAGCLAYNVPTASEVARRYQIQALSFNNTEVSEAEFMSLPFDDSPEIRVLFVGRNQTRKRLDRLVELAKRRSDVRIRLVGPGMDELGVPDDLQISGRVKTFPRTVGPALETHYRWADVVFNPGHVGLLVMNAARYGRGIVIDSSSKHAPEYYLAEEAGQPFIDFSREPEVDNLLDELQRNRQLLRVWGASLQAIARERYTVEHMADVHYEMFRRVSLS